MKYLLKDHCVNTLLALRLPPPNDYSEYISPNNQQNAFSSRKKEVIDQNESNFLVTDGNGRDTPRPPMNNPLFTQEIKGRFGDGVFGYMTQSFDIANTSMQNKSMIQENDAYSPTDAKVQCFSLELAIMNRDLSTLSYLWSSY